jgi:flavin reductase (DIM6/NTAB) family NADH-FMN oxidoreductase RutF
MSFKEISFAELEYNPFTRVEDWALLTCGTIDSFNMMTVTGVMTGKFFLKPMIQVYVHPDRYSYKFFQENDYFNVSFYDRPQHPALVASGRYHGNEVDKLALSGLTPKAYENTVIFEEAQLVFVLKKVFHTDIKKENFDDQNLYLEYYKEAKTYHTIYLGLVEHVLISI